MHISMLSNKFVADPRDVVKAGDVVKVKVIEVDAARKRIALTMRLEEEKQPAKTVNHAEKRHDKPRNSKPQREKQPTNSAMADAFAKLKR